jgi:general stress protein 26
MANTLDIKDIEKLAEIISGIRVAMLTSIDEDGALLSRPMATQDSGFDGALWFFTRSDSAKIESYSQGKHVNVTYSDAEHQRYTSVAGTADLVTDREIIRDLWRPRYSTWFKGGVDDPSIVLIKIAVEKAEYWSGPTGFRRRFGS